MRPFPRHLLVLPILVVGALAGCATGGGQPFQADRVVDVPADRALVYVYRQNAQPTMWGATITADGRDVASLSQGNFTQVTVPEGPHRFGARWAALSGQKESSIDLDVKAGRTYFVELVGLSQMTGVSTNTMGVVMHLKVGSGMLEHGPESRDAMAACCKAVAPY